MCSYENEKNTGWSPIPAVSCQRHHLIWVSQLPHMGTLIPGCCCCKTPLPLLGAETFCPVGPFWGTWAGFMVSLLHHAFIIAQKGKESEWWKLEGLHRGAVCFENFWFREGRLTLTGRMTFKWFSQYIVARHALHSSQAQCLPKWNYLETKTVCILV